MGHGEKHGGAPEAVAPGPNEPESEEAVQAPEQMDLNAFLMLSLRFRKEVEELYRDVDRKDADRKKVSSAPMSWRGLLEPRLPAWSCRQWATQVRHWFNPAHSGEFNEELRRIFNTFEMPMDELRKLIRELFTLSDEVSDKFLQELFRDDKETQEKWEVPEEIRNCRDPLRLIQYAVNGAPKNRKKVPVGRTKEKLPLAWFARRKIAFALLIRSIQQEPAYVNRSDDAAHFEDRMLRDFTGLIDPMSEYQTVQVAFQIEHDKVANVHEIEVAEKDQKVAEGFEVIELIKLQMSGKLLPIDHERKTLTVYAFPGNRNVEDAKKPGLMLLERQEKKTKPSLMSFKRLSAIALKRLRGREVNDYIRCTLLVTTEEDLEMLVGMLNCALSSTINRRDFDKGGNSASSSGYRATHLLEALHNESAQPPRNYLVEIRVGVLQRLLLDRSENHPVWHKNYIVRRSLDILRLFFPEKIVPGVYEDAARMLEKVEGRDSSNGTSELSP